MVLRQFLATFGTHEHDVGVFALQLGPLWPVTDNHLSAWSIQRQESADVLLDRDTADIHLDRRRQVEDRWPRMKQVDINPTGPRLNVRNAPAFSSRRNESVATITPCDGLWNRRITA